MTTSSKTQKFVVTGLSALTSAGDTADSTFSALLNGQSGINIIEQWDISQWKFKYAAELKNYNPQQLVKDRKLLKLISRQDVIGLNSVEQALHHSGILDYRHSLSEQEVTRFNERTGVFVGSPGNRFEQQYDFLPVFEDANKDLRTFGEKVFEHIHPMWLLRILPNNVLAYVGIQYGFKGTNENIVNHATSSMQAIIEACRYIRNGAIDRAIVVGYECAVEPEGQTYYGELGVLSDRDLKPFNKSRNGTILGEAAGCLVIETLEAATQRQAKIYGEILGGQVVSEAQGVFSIQQDGEGVKKVLEKTLATLNLKSNQLDFIVAHGNGTQISDSGEAEAINEICAQHPIPVTAFKWCLGHNLTAAGIVETNMALLALQSGVIPGIANLDQIAFDCQNLQLSAETRKTNATTAALINRGFGSINSCLVIKSYQS